MGERKAKCLIFDLGGVIIDLSIQKTIEEFAALGKKDPQFVQHEYIHNDFFKQHETGRMSDEDFRSFLRDLLNFQGHDAVLDRAWCAMILDIPQQRLDMLTRLRQSHDVFLLSNTNAIHMSRVAEMLAPHGTETFDPFFDKQYYSHLIRRRKPDAEIYEFVLEDNNLEPRDVLFIDDNADNIKGAANLGIQTFHVNTPEALTTFFK